MPQRTHTPRPIRSRLLVRETVLVLGVSLGASACWSVLSLLRKLTAPGPLSQQASKLNSEVTPDRPWLDLAYQLVGIALALVPVLLAVHLLATWPRALSRHEVARALGLVPRRWGADLLWGLALAALMGIPGLGLYLAAKALQLNTTVQAAGLGEQWWTVPVLVLAAVQNAVLEEVLMVGYLSRRWRAAGWRWARVIAASSLIRGAYHLYQGFGGGVGNLVMGLVFGVWYARTRRLWPLIVAHAVLDVVAFVGYAALKNSVSWL